jgi:hypothetical protein
LSPQGAFGCSSLQLGNEEGDTTCRVTAMESSTAARGRAKPEHPLENNSLGKAPAAQGGAETDLQVGPRAIKNAFAG